MIQRLRNVARTGTKDDDVPMTSTFRLQLSLALSLAALPLCVSADAPVGSSITFQQKSDINQSGTFTLLRPDNVSITIPNPPYVLNNPVPGQNTLFIAPPPGVATTVELYDGTILLKSSDTPQISFETTLTSNLRLVVSYKLIDFGDIGVTSYPPGVPFVLSGPQGAKYEGVTPKTYERVPVGSYGVIYSPKGCPKPPAQGGDLKSNEKIYLSITFKCATFQGIRNSDSTLSTTSFHDVDPAAWFAPYVMKAAKVGVMSGYKDENGNPTGQFGPSNPITLAELAKITHSLFALNEHDWQGLPHNESAQGTWFQQIALSAEQRDWVMYWDAKTDLTRPATRAEVVVTFLQAMDVPLQWPKGTVFRDVTRRTPYAAAIETANKLGLISGKTGADGQPNGLFGPSDPINRAELSKLVATLIEKIPGMNLSGNR